MGLRNHRLFAALLFVTAAGLLTAHLFLWEGARDTRGFALVVTLLLLPCAAFPELVGRYTGPIGYGMSLNKSTPASVVRAIAWTGLFGLGLGLLLV